MIFTTVDALYSLYPKGKYVLDGDALIWNDDAPQPTTEQLQAEVVRLQAEYNNAEYKRLRSNEYPPLTDLADAMYWASQGDNTKLDNYYAACEVVKLKYPKS
jgi:hypothetical protein